MKQVHLLISGYVQGVGFRAFVQKEAERLGVVGWVRNTEDGKVEVVAQGDEETLKKFIKACSKGHFFSEVNGAEVEWQSPKEKFESFDKR